MWQRKSAGGMRHEAVVVVGLGQFGGSLTVELARRGVEVLAIDNRREAAQVLAGSSVEFAAADATDADVLRELGVAGFGRAAVAIGGDLPTNILLEVRSWRLDSLRILRLWVSWMPVRSLASV